MASRKGHACLQFAFAITSLYGNTLYAADLSNNKTCLDQECSLSPLCEGKSKQIRDVHVNLVTNTFRDIYSSYLNVHQGSWMRHFGLVTDATNNVEGREKLDKNNFIQAKDNRKSSTKTLDDIGFKYVNDMTWDYEDNITDYYHHLLFHCSKRINLAKEEANNKGSISPAEFQRECWDYLLHEIIHKPRCTTRLDSRVTCRGNSTDVRYLNNTEKGKELIANHLTSANTLNLVILGGGPVGLALSNAVALLDGNILNGNDIPLKVRILLFENRLEYERFPGRKREYSRDWITDISRDPWLKHDVFNADLNRFFKTVTNSYSSIALPIYVFETLLLLSNRKIMDSSNQGQVTKFLFDDFRKYHDLLSSIPNLLVVDAMGNKLDDIKRSSSNDFVTNNSGDTKQIKVGRTFEYNTSSLASNFTSNAIQLQEVYRVLPSDIELIRKHQKPLVLGQCTTKTNETILYPVDLKTRAPYIIHYLKVSNFALTPTIWQELMAIQTMTSCNVSPICVGKGDSIMRNAYRNWCHPYYLYETSRNYRKDIARLMELYPSGFSTRAVIVNLSKEQVIALEEILKIAESRSQGANPILSRNEVSLLDILPMEIKKREKVLGTNNIDMLLLALMKEEEKFMKVTKGRIASASKVSLFKYSPFAYKEPISRNNDFGGSAPVMRMGDSLFTGDANAASGLKMHLYMIARLSCILKLGERCEISL